MTTAIIPWHGMVWHGYGPECATSRRVGARRVEKRGGEPMTVAKPTALLLEFGHRTLSGEAALQVPTRRNVSV